MSKSILSKVAAVACSVASVIALGVCASAEKLEVNGTNYDLDTGKVNLVATKNVVDIEDLNLVINRMVSGVQPVKYSDLLKPMCE